MLPFALAHPNSRYLRHRCVWRCTRTLRQAATIRRARSTLRGEVKSMLMDQSDGIPGLYGVIESAEHGEGR